jgi:hypothetical protein
LPFLRDCRDFFVEMHPDMWKRMTDVNKVVGKLFLQANLEYARDMRALLEGSESLSKCLRKAFEEPESGMLSANYQHHTRLERHAASPLSAFATIAIAAATHERNPAMPGSHHQSRDHQVCTPSINHSRSNLNTNAVRAQNEDTAMQVQASGPLETASVPTALYGQAVQPQLQAFTELNHSGWWPTVDSLQDNSLNRVDPDEWEKTVGGLFTYYGDGTGYT